MHFYQSFFFVNVLYLMSFYMQVCVEGNIASGKTTFLEYFKPEMTAEVISIFVTYSLCRYLTKSWNPNTINCLVYLSYTCTVPGCGVPKGETIEDPYNL